MLGEVLDSYVTQHYGALSYKVEQNSPSLSATFHSFWEGRHSKRLQSVRSSVSSTLRII